MPGFACRYDLKDLKDLHHNLKDLKDLKDLPFYKGPEQVPVSAYVGSWKNLKDLKRT